MRKMQKYPRTHHLPWSEGVTSDDKVVGDTHHFEGVEVVVTIKMDGENTTIYADGYSHARSMDSAHHPSRNMVKAEASRIQAEGLPESFRICGENCYAKHSIAYTDLPSYFLVFSIWDGDRCLSWEETEMWCELLGLKAVEVIYKGPWDESAIKKAWEGRSGGNEGYVVRVAAEFNIKDFKTSLNKWVRKDHVQTESHWMHQEITPNGIRR
jgi:hypothetical protein